MAENALDTALVSPDECGFRELPDGPLCRKPAAYRVEGRVATAFLVGPDGVDCAEAFTLVTMGVCEEHHALLDNPIAYSMGCSSSRGCSSSSEVSRDG